MSIKPRACRRRGCGGCPRCEPDGCEASRGWHGHQPAGVYRPACEGRRTPLRGGVCAFVGGASSYVCPWSPWGAACGGGWPVRWRWVQAGALTWAPASPKLREAARLHRLAECVGQGEHTWPSANYAPPAGGMCVEAVARQPGACEPPPWRLPRPRITCRLLRHAGWCGDRRRWPASVGSADNYPGAMEEGFRSAADAFSRPRPRVSRPSMAALALLLGGMTHPDLGAVEVHPDPKRRRR